MTTKQPSKRSILEFVAIFLLLYVLSSYGLSYLFPEWFGGKVPPKEVTLSMEYSRLTIGNDPIALLNNLTNEDVILEKRCPLPPLDIARVEGSIDSESLTVLLPNESVLPCVDEPVLKAGEKRRLNLGGWKYVVFSEPGVYELSLERAPKDGEAALEPLKTRVTIVEPGFFRKLFRTFVSKPLINGLIAIASFMPGRNLGLAIIVLTIIIKLILLAPNQHALEGQKKLSALQPRIDEIKKKYPNDPTRVQEETMKLWKEMKINPLQSCLPMLLQLPILIGLFVVIRDGTHIALMRHLLYGSYAALPYDYFGTTFLGLDLLKPEKIFFPLALILLQFWQMKMMLLKKKKKPDEIVVTPTGKKSWVPELDQQTIMTYVLPLMIGYFALQFPAAVSIYWGISTLFGIVQQWFVMRKK